MKKKIYAAAIIAFFALTFVLSIYMSSIDNVINRKNNFNNISVPVDSAELVNWSGSDGTYISDADPQIIINGVNSFVHTLKISGTFSAASDMVQVFFTESPEEDFSEEKSFFTTYSISGNNIYIKVDKQVSSLRVDLTDEAGAEMIIRKLEINDRSLLLSINSVAKYCVLPTFLLGIILFTALKRKEIIPYIRTFKKYVPLLSNLISRDLKVKYRRSVLGFLWSILNPLLMALVINVVFSKLFRFQVQYFATYYLVGSLIFNFVVECTSNSMTSVLGAAPLIKKVYIPKYIFPMQKCAFAFINMLFGSVAVIVVMVIQGVPFHLTMLLFFVPMIYALVFAYGFGLILAAFTVFFRDIEHLYSVWVSIWMYLTPIIYPEELLVSNGLSVIMKLNPMYYYVHMLRSIVMYGTLPAMSEHIMCISFALIFLAAGLGIFKKTQDRFILYI